LGRKKGPGRGPVGWERLRGKIGLACTQNAWSGMKGQNDLGMFGGYDKGPGPVAPKGGGLVINSKGSRGILSDSTRGK